MLPSLIQLEIFDIFIYISRYYILCYALEKCNPVHDIYIGNGKNINCEGVRWWRVKENRILVFPFWGSLFSIWNWHLWRNRVERCQKKWWHWFPGDSLCILRSFSILAQKIHKFKNILKREKYKHYLPREDSSWQLFHNKFSFLLEQCCSSYNSECKL